MAGTCVDRTLTVRSLLLDDQKIENPTASGTRNSPFSLQDAEGGIVWQVKK